MPSGETHRAIARAFGVKDSREVDRLMDSTVHQHGSAHRNDPIHSIGGVARALALRDRLTGDAIRAAALHLAADQTISTIMKRTRLKGASRRAAQLLLEDHLQRLAKERGR